MSDELEGRNESNEYPAFTAKDLQIFKDKIETLTNSYNAMCQKLNISFSAINNEFGAIQRRLTKLEYDSKKPKVSEDDAVVNDLLNMFGGKK